MPTDHGTLQRYWNTPNTSTDDPNLAILMHAHILTYCGAEPPVGTMLTTDLDMVFWKVNRLYKTIKCFSDLSPGIEMTDDMLW